MEDKVEGAVPPYSVVYFGNDWFAENRTSSHHIARRLAARVPVLYVDSPGLRAPSASSRDFRRLWRKLSKMFRLPVQLGPNLWHCTVPQVPYRRLPGVGFLNRMFGLWAVRRAIRHVDLGRRVSWFVAPHPGFMAKRLGESLCVYYCTDDHSAHPGVDVATIRRVDMELTRAADLVFVAPPALVAAKTRANSGTVFAPHGVDVDLFSKAMDPVTEIPQAARDLRHPVVGYFGSIAAWIDIELIESLARARPDWSFLLVGHSFVDVSRLQSLPNVLLVGPQPYESLPRWAKAFDVAIIPYRQNQQVLNANPLKLREYLATGRPIVATTNPEIEKFAQWVRIAKGPEEFLRAVEAALAPESQEAVLERLALVKDSTWDARAADVFSRVERALEIAGTTAGSRSPTTRV